MEILIDKYVLENKDNGLILLTSPTGSGKTYAVLLWAFKYLTSNEKKKKKIFFTTPLKKNLPIAEARKFFENEGLEKLFDDISLFLDSNSESAISNFDQAQKLIPYDSKIRERREFKALQNDIQNIKNMRGRGDNLYSRETKDLVVNNFREKTEPNFRKAVKDLLNKEGRNVKARLNLIKNDDQWKWLAVLYPGVLLSEKQLIFVSWDKFILRNSSIMEDSEYFFDSKAVKNSVIFIDEFDSTKRKALDRVVEEASRKTIEYVGLFKTIYSHIHEQKMHGDLLTESKKRSEGNYNKTVNQIFEEFIHISDEINNKYHLNNVFKLAEDSRNTNQAFLFRDSDNITISNTDKNNYIWLIADDSKNTNTIAFKKDRPLEDSSDIQKMLSEIKGFITYFTNGIAFLAENYIQLKTERNSTDDEISFESAVKTVISALYIDNELYKEYLASLAISRRNSSKKGTKEDKLGISFHNSGFRFNAFNDDASHDVKTEIITTTFEDSPENLLLKFCERAKVIGISATADVPTVLGNYDLKYLYRQLGDKFVTIGEEDKERLRKQYQKSIEFYDRVKICTYPVEDTDKNKEAYENWMNIFKNEELALSYANEVNRMINSDFYRNRYYKFATLMKTFLLNKDSYAFLYVCNMFPKENNSKFDLSLIKRMTTDIAKENNIEMNVNDVLWVLYSSDYLDNLNKVHEAFQKTRKVFLISTYNTLGAGQNIQAPIPEELKNELVQINSFSPSGKMDFDSIYLENPTYLLKNAADIHDNLTLSNYLYQIEYLKNNYEISSQESYNAVTSGFRSLLNGIKKETAPSFKETDSNRCFLSLIVIQALGRICRTNMKCKNISIFYDSIMKGKMDFSFIDKEMSNPELVKLIEDIEINESVSESEKTLFKIAKNKNKIANDHIHSMLNSGWGSQNQEEWKELRDFALKHPTGDLKILDDSIGFYYYFKNEIISNSIYYKQNNDYGEIALSNYNQSGYIEESEENARLTILMENAGFRKLFEENGWATNWEKGECLMLPVFYNNIYKGALGEVCGKYVFERGNIELEELEDPNNFEVFDYKIKGKKIYVDFKHWRESTVFDAKETLNKIVNKARSLGDCKAVIIANLMSSYSTTFSKNVEDIRIIEIPSLLSVKDDGIHVNMEAWNRVRQVFEDEQYND